MNGASRSGAGPWLRDGNGGYEPCDHTRKPEAWMAAAFADMPLAPETVKSHLGSAMRKWSEHPLRGGRRRTSTDVFPSVWAS